MNSIFIRIVRKIEKLSRFSWFRKLCRTEIPELTKEEEGKKRILFVHALMALGGGEKITEDVLLGLNHDEFLADVAILCRNPERPNLYEPEMRRAANLLWDVPELAGSLFNVAFFEKILKTRRYDHVVFVGSNSYMNFIRSTLKRAYCPRYTCAVHNDWPEFIHDAAENLDVFDHYLAVCEYIKDRLYEWENVPKNFVSVVFNGVKTDVFNPEHYSEKIYRNQFRIQNNDLVVGFTTRFDPEKHPEFFLKIAQKLSDVPKIRFILAGTGVLWDEMRQKVETMGLSDRIFLPGMVRDVPQLLSECDLYCHCVKYEAWGLSIVEAMAMGLPCVVTRVGGIPEFFEDGTHGLMIEYDAQTPQNAARAIRRILIEEPEKWKNCRTVNRARAEEFSTQRMVEGYEKYFRTH